MPQGGDVQAAPRLGSFVESAAESEAASKCIQVCKHAAYGMQACCLWYAGMLLVVYRYAGMQATVCQLPGVLHANSLRVSVHLSVYACVSVSVYLSVSAHVRVLVSVYRVCLCLAVCL